MAIRSRAPGENVRAIMICMSTETQYARRLRLLMSHLDLTSAEFAARVGLSEGYVSRVLAGERGKGGLPKLHEKAAAALGVPGHYWTAKADVSPADALRSPAGGAGMGTMIGEQRPASAVDYRAQLAQLAADRDEPAEVVKALLRTEAPSGADAAWWFARYLDLRTAATHD